MLLSDCVDRAVSRVDFRALAGKKVFLDDTPVKTVTDAPYLISAVRQHIMASGGILREKREEADYVVELRAGAIGTDRDDLLFGVPAMTMPVSIPVAGVPSQIPEIPLVKRTDQRGVARVSLFVYNRTTGRIVWQSGLVPEESKARATWVFGSGPFQRGSIHKGTKFAGDRLSIPLIDLDKKPIEQRSPVSVAEQAFFVEPVEQESVARADKPLADRANAGSSPSKDQAAASAPGKNESAVLQTGHTAPDDRAVPGGPAPTGAVVPPRIGEDVEAKVRRLPVVPPGGDRGEDVPHMDPWPLWRR